MGKWQDRELVFTTDGGGRLDKDAALRAFRKVVTKAGLDPKQWTPREQRHTFVPVLSDEDVPIEKISDLVGDKDQTTTETVYRHQIRPVVIDGAEAMDRIFPEDLLFQEAAARALNELSRWWQLSPDPVYQQPTPFHEDVIGKEHGHQVIPIANRYP